MGFVHLDFLLFAFWVEWAKWHWLIRGELYLDQMVFRVMSLPAAN